MNKLRGLSDLALGLGLPLAELEEIRTCHNYYSVVTIKKRQGGTRQLTVPSDRLKVFQRAVLDTVLRTVSVAPCVHGSVRGRDTWTHALVHRRARAVYVLDLKNAFTQASRSRVESVFRSLGFNETAVNYLADITTFEDVLPQGAPTSNTLWNFVCRGLDERLLALARERGLSYTRYTDELVFSHSSHLDPAVRSEIQQVVSTAGFVINSGKTHYYHARHGALRLMGITISDGDLKLPKKIIERIRGIVHRACTDRKIPLEFVEGLLGEVRRVYGQFLPRRINEDYKTLRALRGLSV